MENVWEALKFLIKLIWYYIIEWGPISDIKFILNEIIKVVSKIFNSPILTILIAIWVTTMAIHMIIIKNQKKKDR